MEKLIKDSLAELKSYCEQEGFKGFDPYDGLNSRFFQSLPFIPRNRLLGLVWIQTFKRSPLNLRRLVGIKKETNPKALGIFLTVPIASSIIPITGKKTWKRSIFLLRKF